MKQTVKVLAIAILGMSLAVACKNAPAEEAVDTTPIDTMIVEEVVDTIVEEAPDAEEPVKQAPAKKAETKVMRNDASQVTIKTDQGSATLGKSGVSVKSEDKNDASKVTIKTNQGSATFGK